jgi:hypothetical protein
MKNTPSTVVNSCLSVIGEGERELKDRVRAGMGTFLFVPSMAKGENEMADNNVWGDASKNDMIC